MKPTRLLLLALIITGFVQNALAQDAKPTTYLRPDFYSRISKVILDTTFTYEVYDARDSILDADTLVNFDKVKYISLFKYYYDHSHKYRDYDGIEKPIPLSKIMYRYDKTTTTKWIAVDYATNKMSQVTELKEQIVKEETVQFTDPKTGTVSTRVYSYYGHTTSDF